MNPQPPDPQSGALPIELRPPRAAIIELIISFELVFGKTSVVFWYNGLVNMKLKSLLLLVLPAALAIILTFVLQITLLARQDLVTEWLKSFGPWFILVYVFTQILTIVIAPLGGLFAQIAIIAILKPFWGLVLVYLVSTPAFLINFYLSRKFGRPLVTKLIGTKAMSKIDHYAEDVDTVTLVLLKILQGGYFDYISYAVGLTNISFRIFALVNFLAGIPSIILSYFIFSTFDSLVWGVLTLWLTTGVLLAISIYVNHRIRKHKISKRNSL